MEILVDKRGKEKDFLFFLMNFLKVGKFHLTVRLWHAFKFNPKCYSSGVVCLVSKAVHFLWILFEMCIIDVFLN